MEMKVGKNEYDDSLKATITSTGQKQLQNVQYFSHLGNMITNDARCRHEIKPRIAMAKAAFSKKKTLFTSNVELMQVSFFHFHTHVKPLT